MVSDSAGSWIFLGRLRPVIGIVANRGNYFLSGNDVCNTCLRFSTYQSCDATGPGRGSEPMLIVVHQQNGVALFAEEAVFV